MTYSLVGMCRRTGMFGAAVTTSNMNVGTRCPFAKAGVGAVLTQHRTDNRLGLEGLALLDDGNRAPRVIDALAADNPSIGWRQLAATAAPGFITATASPRPMPPPRATAAAPSETSSATREFRNG